MRNTKYTYFTRSGDYGDVDIVNEWTDLIRRYPGVGVTAMVTDTWTDVMWEAIKACAPNRRSEMANHISTGIHLTDNTDTCKWCGISKDLLSFNGKIAYSAPAPKARPAQPVSYAPVVSKPPVVLDSTLKDALVGAVDHVKELHADEIQSTLDQINK
jgi:hypothetical protein